MIVMAETENEDSYKGLMAASAAAAAGSAGALAVYNGHLPEGLEYVSQAKDMVEPVFYDPETGPAAENWEEYAVGNVDTAMHFLSGAGLSGLANKVLNPSSRTKALAAGLGAGTVGYALLKEGMYEGALDAFDVSYESIKAASSPTDHILQEANDIDLSADQERDIQADTAGVMTERSLSSTPSIGGKEIEQEEYPEESEIDRLVESQNGPWTPDILDEPEGSESNPATV
jgi:hypothetical protein